MEPRRKAGLADTMNEFYEKINDPTMKGAIFFAVCRGKVCTGPFSRIFIILCALVF